MYLYVNIKCLHIIIYLVILTVFVRYKQCFSYKLTICLSQNLRSDNLKLVQLEHYQISKTEEFCRCCNCPLRTSNESPIAVTIYSFVLLLKTTYDLLFANDVVSILVWPIIRFYYSIYIVSCFANGTGQMELRATLRSR